MRWFPLAWRLTCFSKRLEPCRTHIFICICVTIVCWTRRRLRLRPARKRPQITLSDYLQNLTSPTDSASCVHVNILDVKSELWSRSSENKPSSVIISLNDISSSSSSSSLSCPMTLLLPPTLPQVRAFSVQITPASLIHRLRKRSTRCSTLWGVFMVAVVVVVVVVVLLWLCVAFLQTCWNKPTQPVWLHSPPLLWDGVLTCAVALCRVSVFSVSSLRPETEASLVRAPTCVLWRARGRNIDDQQKLYYRVISVFILSVLVRGKTLHRQIFSCASVILNTGTSQPYLSDFLQRFIASPVRFEMLLFFFF